MNEPQVGDIFRTSKNDQYYMILSIGRKIRGVDDYPTVTADILWLKTGKILTHFPIFTNDEKIA